MSGIQILKRKPSQEELEGQSGGTNPITEQEEENSASAIINNIQYEQGMFVYSFKNISDIYTQLTTQQWISLAWPFRYYNEIFDSEEETENLEQAISDSVNDLSSTADHMVVKQHKIFKNLLFNIKEIAVLGEDGFKTMTYADLQQLYIEENKFYLGRLAIGQKIRDSLLTLFGSNTPTNFSKHSELYKYFIVSSEPIMFNDYKEILPESRDEEEWFVNNFDSIDVELPELATETNISFTYLKSNYVEQSKKGNMSLKGIKEELSTTETSTQVGTVSIQNTGY